MQAMAEMRIREIQEQEETVLVDADLRIEEVRRTIAAEIAECSEQAYKAKGKSKWDLMFTRLHDIFFKGLLDDSPEAKKELELEKDGRFPVPQYDFSFAKRAKKQVHDRTVSLIERKEGDMNEWFASDTQLLEDIQLYCENLESNGYTVVSSLMSLGRATHKNNTRHEV